MASAGWMAWHDLYRGLKREDVDRLGERCIEIAFAKNDVIVQQGQKSWPGLYFLRAGTAKVVVRDEDGERVIADLHTGEPIGEMTLGNPDEPRSATVVAVTDCTSLFLSHEEYERLKHDAPDTTARLNEVLLHVLSARLRRRSQNSQPGS